MTAAINGSPSSSHPSCHQASPTTCKHAPIKPHLVFKYQQYPRLNAASRELWLQRVIRGQVPTGVAYLIFRQTFSPLRTCELLTTWCKNMSRPGGRAATTRRWTPTLDHYHSQEAIEMLMASKGEIRRVSYLMHCSSWPTPQGDVDWKDRDRSTSPR